MPRTLEEHAPEGFEEFARAWAILLTTYRKSGQPVGTPVWLVVRGGRILATTTVNSGKVKRIRNDPRVTVAACTQTGRIIGPAREGRAHLMSPADTEAALTAIRGRYGLFDRIMSLINRLQGEAEEVGIEIVPLPSERGTRSRGGG